MGNVHAASAPPAPSQLTLSPELPPNVSNQDLPAALDGGDRLQNPGTMEDLHKKCKDLFPVNFEGAKLMLNKGLSNHFQISHTINMSSSAPSGYRFGATYVGTKQTSPTEAFPVLLGDIDPSGNLNANVIHQFGQRIKGRLATQVQRSKFTAVQMTSDYRGDSYTLSATLGNPDIINNCGVMVLHYLKSITPQLALGGEVAYQKAPTIPGGSVTVASAAGRYTRGDFTLSASLGFGGCHLCFHQKASDQIQVGVELEVNPRMQECMATIGYQIDLPKADLVFRGSVDSNWKVGAVLEKKLQPLPFSFVLSSVIDHNKGYFRLGCGLIVG